MPQRVAARLWPNTDSVRAVADGDSCQHAAVLRADRVHLGVVAPRQPKHFAIGGNASHVGASADVPFGNEPSGSEIEHRDRSLAPVRDVELLRVPAGIETVCAGARIDEPEHVPTGQQPWALILEFQLEPDPLLFGRAMIYGGQLWIEVKPSEERGDRFLIGVLVVNLTGRGSTGRTMALPGTRILTAMQPQEVSLCELDAKATLDGIAAGTGSIVPGTTFATGSN